MYVCVYVCTVCMYEVYVYMNVVEKNVQYFSLKCSKVKVESAMKRKDSSKVHWLRSEPFLLPKLRHVSLYVYFQFGG